MLRFREMLQSTGPVRLIWVIKCATRCEHQTCFSQAISFKFTAIKLFSKGVNTQGTHINNKSWDSQTTIEYFHYQLFSLFPSSASTALDPFGVVGAADGLGDPDGVGLGLAGSGPPRGVNICLAAACAPPNSMRAL